MSKELQIVKKDFRKLSPSEIFQLLRDYRKNSTINTKLKLTSEYANIIYMLLEYFSEKGDINSELALLNQLVELTWVGKDTKEFINLLEKAIFLILVDSQKIRGKTRISLIQDYLEIIIRFPKNRKIYETITRAILELMKWGTDVKNLCHG